MKALTIAFRNILRNQRRSFLTGSTVAAGAMAMLLFAGFINNGFAGLETRTVQEIGHLTVFRRGYFLFGAGNPEAYGIDSYRSVRSLIEHDPVLRPMINVITSTQSVMGIAGNFSGDNDASKTFLGVGLIPSDRDRMRQWDEFGVGIVGPRSDPNLSDDDINRGIVGVGLARMLSLCAPLRLPNCGPPPNASDTSEKARPVVDQDIAELARREASDGARSSHEMPQIDLLAATAGGAPNVVSLAVSGAEQQAVKQLDDNYVVMNLKLAQELVYGRGEHKVTGIVLQLHRSEDLEAARKRLVMLIQQHHLDLEVRDFAELTPFYGQVVRMFSTIFLFIAFVMGVIALFAVVNTMTMNVVERTAEIGTLRALGARRSVVRSQFIVEGALIGAIGATAGPVLALGIAALFNRLGLTWTPPGNATPGPLRLIVLGRPSIVIGVWIGLVLVAMVAALIPARRAARLSVVDALRHV